MYWQCSTGELRAFGVDVGRAMEPVRSRIGRCGLLPEQWMAFGRGIYVIGNAALPVSNAGLPCLYRMRFARRVSSAADILKRPLTK